MFAALVSYGLELAKILNECEAKTSKFSNVEYYEVRNLWTVNRQKFILKRSGVRVQSEKKMIQV